MNNRENLDKYTKEQLIDLIEIYSKNMLALDGYWFQGAEKTLGMDKAMELDCLAWEGFTVTEARRIKKFLNLEDDSGLDGLEKALNLRMNRNNHPCTIQRIDENTLVYTVVDCMVQSARAKKGMEFHPCKPVGLKEHEYFAKTIDSRIETECVSCYPDVTEKDCGCKWKFTLKY